MKVCVEGRKQKGYQILTDAIVETQETFLSAITSGDGIRIPSQEINPNYTEDMRSI